MWWQCNHGSGYQGNCLLSRSRTHFLFFYRCIELWKRRCLLLRVRKSLLPFRQAFFRPIFGKPGLWFCWNLEFSPRDFSFLGLNFEVSHLDFRVLSLNYSQFNLQFAIFGSKFFWQPGKMIKFITFLLKQYNEGCLLRTFNLLGTYSLKFVVTLSSSPWLLEFFLEIWVFCKFFF